MSASPQLMIQAKTGFPKLTPYEENEYRKAWQTATMDVISKLDQVVKSNNIPKAALQIFF